MKNSKILNCLNQYLESPISSNLIQQMLKSILLHYTHDFDENLKMLYTKLVTNNDFDHKSYDVRQSILTYSGLLKLCSDQLMDCTFQIRQLTSQRNNIFATLGLAAPKHAKRDIIHSLFNFLFDDQKVQKKLMLSKNMSILEENQDILSS